LSSSSPLRNFFLTVLGYARVALCILGLLLYVPALHIESLLLGYTIGRGFKYRRWFISYYVRVLNIKIRKSGDSNIPNALYVSNHRMMIDPVILLRDCDAYIVSKAEVASYPILGNGAKNTGVIFVRRNHRGSRAAIKEKIGELLSAGGSVAIFPEGTVNLNPLTAEFSRGSFDEAAKTGCAVVPVALDYDDTSVYWSSDTSLVRHFLDVFKKPRLESHIVFGPPIRSSDPMELLRRSQAFIDDALQEMRREWDQPVS